MSPHILLPDRRELYGENYFIEVRFQFQASVLERDSTTSFHQRRTGDSIREDPLGEAGEHIFMEAVPEAEAGHP